MELTAQSAADLITEEVAALQPAGEGVAASNVPADFCAVWKKAKPVLDGVAGIIIFFPGFGAVAAGVLKGLIKVGDQIAAQVCN